MKKENIKPKKNEIKILLLGDTGVGKTSIFKRYLENKYEGNKTATVGVDFSTRNFKYKNENYIIQVFDNAGQERFKGITKSYFHMSEYYFVVFDLTNKNSLDAIPSWLELLKEEKENPKYIILGNKDDLKNKQISEDEINNVLENLDNININGEKFLRVSAKNGNNIENAFKYMIDVFNNDNNENKGENNNAKLTKTNLQKKNSNAKCCK